MKSDSLLKYVFFFSLRGLFIEGTPVAVLCSGFCHVGRCAMTLWTARALPPLGLMSPLRLAQAFSAFAHSDPLRKPHVSLYFPSHIHSTFPFCSVCLRLPPPPPRALQSRAAALRSPRRPAGTAAGLRLHTLRLSSTRNRFPGD